MAMCPALMEHEFAIGEGFPYEPDGVSQDMHCLLYFAIFYF